MTLLDHGIIPEPGPDEYQDDDSGYEYEPDAGETWDATQAAQERHEAWLETNDALQAAAAQWQAQNGSDGVFDAPPDNEIAQWDAGHAGVQAGLASAQAAIEQGQQAGVEALEQLEAEQAELDEALEAIEQMVFAEIDNAGYWAQDADPGGVYAAAAALYEDQVAQGVDPDEPGLGQWALQQAVELAKNHAMGAHVIARTLP
jgi:hypothetical protein